MDIYASDEEKGEGIKQWWRDHGTSVVIGTVLGIAVIFSGRYWIDSINNQRIQASAYYQQVLGALSQEQTDAAQKATDRLFNEFSKTPYAVFAAFNMAANATKEKDVSTAQTYLKWIIANADLAAHKELAEFRLAKLFLAQKQLEQALALTEGDKAEPFLSLWLELEGDIYIALAKPSEARAAYQSALIGLAQSEPRKKLLQIKLDDVAASSNG